MSRRSRAEQPSSWPTSSPASYRPSSDLVAPPLRVLRAVQRDQQFPVSPEIGLAVPWLFTAGKGSPSLLQEIRRELASSDQVDILVSFITVSGVRKLQDVLQQITAKGARKMAGEDAAAHPHHHLHRRDRGACAGRAGAPAGVRGARVAGRPAHAPACQGLAVPAQDRFWLGLCRQRQPVGRRADRRAGVDGQADPARARGAVRTRRGPLRDAVGRQRVPALRPGQRRTPAGAGGALGRESFGGEPSATISFFDLQPKTYQQEMLEQLAPSAPTVAPQPAGGGHRHRQDGGGGVRLPEHLPHRRWAPSPAVRGPPRGDPAPGLRTYREVLRDPRVRRPAHREPPTRALGPPVRHHRQRDQPRPGGHRRRRPLAHRGGG
jgi:hypothetical protein